MTVGRRPQNFLATALLAACAFLLAPAARAQAALVHGQVRLEVLVDGPTVLIRMQAPLDDLLGFDRAPRSDAERQAVDDLVARLRAADALFAIDRVANCKLGPVELRSAVLGLGPQAAAAEAGDGHADLDASFAFNCTNAVAAKYVDLGLFGAFKSVRQIDARISAPQGQFQRSLKRPATRLAWNA